MENNTVNNGVKLVGELILPGSSQLLDQNMKGGLLHIGAGILARGVFGLPGALVVAANSYTKSVTDQNLVAKVFAPNQKDPREQTLVSKVNQDVKAGLSLEEIQESLQEDVQDLYAEVVAGQKAD